MGGRKIKKNEKRSNYIGLENIGWYDFDRILTRSLAQQIRSPLLLNRGNFLKKIKKLAVFHYNIIDLNYFVFYGYYREKRKMNLQTRYF